MNINIVLLSCDHFSLSRFRMRHHAWMHNGSISNNVNCLKGCIFNVVASKQFTSMHRLFSFHCGSFVLNFPCNSSSTTERSKSKRIYNELPASLVILNQMSFHSKIFVQWKCDALLNCVELITDQPLVLRFEMEHNQNSIL